MKTNILFFALMSMVLINNVVVYGNPRGGVKITVNGMPLTNSESFEKAIQGLRDEGVNVQGSYYHSSEQKTTGDQEPATFNDQGHFGSNSVQPTSNYNGNNRFDSRPPGPG